MEEEGGVFKCLQCGKRRDRDKDKESGNRRIADQLAASSRWVSAGWRKSQRDNYDTLV